jgi:hypothetical protein
MLVVDADGVLEEFEIALEAGSFLLPERRAQLPDQFPPLALSFFLSYGRTSHKPIVLAINRANRPTLPC